MKLHTSLATAALVTLATGQSDVTCHDGLYVIVARASGEQPGYGILGVVKDDILAKVPASDSIAVPYPATITNPIYFVSEPQGVGNLTEIITQYGDACPTSKMALLGYSQGAQVIGDTLLGTDYITFSVFMNTTGIAQKYIDNIVAVVMMGDPANVAGQPFLVGNSTNNGTFPRNNTEEWVNRGLVDKLQSYCDASDYFCDGGRAANSVNVHIGYVLEYRNQAVDFVVGKATNGTSGNGTSPGSGSGSPSGSASPSSTTASGSGGSPTASTPGQTSTTTAPPNSAWSMKGGLSTYVAVGLLQCALTLIIFS